MSDVWACADCLLWLVNAQPNPEWSEDDQNEHVGRIDERFPDQLLIYVGDEVTDVEFSTLRCDTCGSPLAGSRYRFAVIGPPD